MTLRDFWYVVGHGHELVPGEVWGRKVLGEWIAVFRDADGKVVALQDRCRHRAGRLSRGKVRDGCLRCPYHGWTYDGAGKVVAVPSEGRDFKFSEKRNATRYAACERDGYVYVNLGDPALAEPFAIPHHGERGYRSLRLVNRIRNGVTNCVENFLDIPHTVFVHPGIFRRVEHRRISARIRREAGTVKVEYGGETDNLGWFKWFLNPGGTEILHRDEFYMPNVTHVEYRFGPRRHFLITSQSVPEEDGETVVYTDLTWDYGIFGAIAAPLVRWQAQRIIDQDVDELEQQRQVIDKYGDRFCNTPADAIHVHVESIVRRLERGEDPRALPTCDREIGFWV